MSHSNSTSATTPTLQPQQPQRLARSGPGTWRRTALILCAAAFAASFAHADTDTAAATPAVPDRYTATTTAMTPRDVELRIDVRTWSDDEGRAAVVDALARIAGVLGQDEVRKTLTGLPTLGYVWQSGSSVGYSVKYAHRTPAEASERVTFVTDRRLGAHEFKPWTAEAPAVNDERPYSVIELYLDGEGRGTGTFSLAAEVQVDAENALVGLSEGAPRLLANAALAPKPYSATTR